MNVFEYNYSRQNIPNLVESYLLYAKDLNSEVDRLNAEFISATSKIYLDGTAYNNVKDSYSIPFNSYSPYNSNFINYSTSFTVGAVYDSLYSHLNVIIQTSVGLQEKERTLLSSFASLKNEFVDLADCPNQYPNSSSFIVVSNSSLSYLGTSAVIKDNLYDYDELTLGSDLEQVFIGGTSTSSYVGYNSKYLDRKDFIEITEASSHNPERDTVYQNELNGTSYTFSLSTADDNYEVNFYSHGTNLAIVTTTCLAANGFDNGESYAFINEEGRQFFAAIYDTNAETYWVIGR